MTFIIHLLCLPKIRSNEDSKDLCLLGPSSEMEILPYHFEPDVISSELDSEAHLSTTSTETDVADHIYYCIGNTDC